MNDWSQVSSIPNLGVWRGMAFSSNDYGFVGLGLNSSEELNSDFWKYDAILDSWTLSSLDLTPRIYPAYSKINDKLFVYGGVDSLGVFMNTFESLDLVNSQVLDLGVFPSEARRGAMAFASTNAFYLTTGLIPTERLGETWKASNILSLTPAYQQKIKFTQIEGRITIISSGNVEKFELFSIEGKMAGSVRNTNVMNTDFLENGIYFYNIMFEKTGISASGKINVLNK